MKENKILEIPQEHLDKLKEEERIKGIARDVKGTQSFRMLQDALFFINSVGMQDDFLNHAPKADRELYLSVWD